ncbi:hypothetical protein BS47DRAFT_1360698 [Hydnum rufescens UP504]|uniref:Uncharacterized protein n=1 Tax=Hydnum rufescens UP504 TaxID=1448309 RepID=A0A9P6DYQ2_9AGAM|nr:hypothetical protein BS47DRAFT_1360698 [Hydnum rufescens UP504]
MANLDALKALHMHLASATAISQWLSRQAAHSTPAPLGAINHPPPDAGPGRRLIGPDQPGTRLRYDDPTDDRFPRGAPRDNYPTPDRHIYAPTNGELARHNSISSRLPPHPRPMPPHDLPHRGREDQAHSHDYHDSYERRDRQAAYDSRDELYPPPQKHAQQPPPIIRQFRAPTHLRRLAGPHSRRGSPPARYPEPAPPSSTLENQPVALQGIRSRKQPGAILVNSAGQRICRECGQIGRYRDGRCIEKWGPVIDVWTPGSRRTGDSLRSIRNIPGEPGQQPSPPNEIPLVPPPAGSPKVPLLRRISPHASDDMEVDQDDEDEDQERSYSPRSKKEASDESSSKRRPLMIWGQDSTRTHIPSRGSQPLPPSLRPVSTTSRSCSPDELSD